MLRSNLAAFGLATAAVFSLAACGGTTSPGPGEEPDETGKVPPPAPAETPGESGAQAVLAINKLYLGDTQRNGTPHKDAWKEYGFNLDGKISTEGSTDLCKPIAGGSAKTVYLDGNDGIDNSFGKNILVMLKPFEPELSATVSSGIAEGNFTIMLAIDGFGSGDTYNPLTTKLYGGANLGGSAKFDGTDEWPLINELLNGGDVNNPKVQFKQSYVTGNTWVSGSKGPLTLNLSIAGYTLNLTIGAALLSMDVAGDRKSATNGTIGGVIATEPLINELKKVAVAFEPSLCDGSTFEGIANQIRAASDILADGSQDPGKNCDGISIGIGFDMKSVRLGPVAEPAGPVESPCDAQ